MTAPSQTMSAHECIAEEQWIELASGGCDGERAFSLLAAVEGCADCHALMLEAVRALAESPCGRNTWSSPNEAALRWEVGALVANRYRIVRCLGSGGMGDVYEASDIELTQRVALKTIAASFSRHETSLERLKQEVRLARRVVHPNVCRVLEFGCHREPGGNRYFLTMELLDGELLSTALRREGPMSPQAAREIARQIAEGLRAIHAQNVVHRDVKASNILLTNGEGGQAAYGRRAVLLDFGIARSLDEHAQPLTTHGRVGTPDYMAPEQVRGEAVSPATDVYALGVVLFELLCGQLPRDGGRGRSPWATAPCPNQLPSSPAALAGVPPELAAVVRWCLAPDPAARPQTMEVLLHALKQIEHDGRVAPRPERPHGSPAAYVSAVGCVLLALVLAVSGIAFMRSEPEIPSGIAEASRAASLAATGASAQSLPAGEAQPSGSAERATRAAVLREDAAPDDERGRKVSARETPPPGRSAPDAQRQRCSPPYYYEQGIRIYRRECL